MGFHSTDEDSIFGKAENKESDRENPSVRDNSIPFGLCSFPLSQN